MKRACLVIGAFALLLSSTRVLAEENPEPFKVVMLDGQLTSRPIEVFVNQEVSTSMKPRLKLMGRHVFDRVSDLDSKVWSPGVVAKNQQVELEVLNKKIPTSGTLMLFNLQDYQIELFKPVVAAVPVLSWMPEDGGGAEAVAVGEAVYLANGPAVAAYTALAVVVLVVCLFLLSKLASGEFLAFLYGRYGFLSLSRVQVAAWTLATGGVVFAFGLMRLQVPEIPPQILALMGLSLATGGIKYVKSGAGSADTAPSGEKTSAEKTSAEKRRGRSVFSALTADAVISPKGDQIALESSLPKTQMLFWTGIMLILFVSKSVLDGELWPIPWEMVALMGMSQAGYLSVDFDPNKPQAQSSPNEGQGKKEDEDKGDNPPG